MIDSFSLSWDAVVALRLITAFICGVIVGYDREQNNKAAGIRTQMLVSVGSALLTIVSISLAQSFRVPDLPSPDPARLAAQIVSGIGFIGAGAILKGENRVTGVTTAATIWVTAALGIALGAGYYLPALVVLVCVLLLTPLAKLQYRIGLKTNFYECMVEAKDLSQLEHLMQEMGIPFYIHASDNRMVTIAFSTSDDIRKRVSHEFLKRKLRFTLTRSDS